MGGSMCNMSLSSSVVTEELGEPENLSVRVVGQLGDFLGAGVSRVGEDAVIFKIKDNGLLDAWNKANPSQTLYPGLIIKEVNGVTGYWSILEELFQRSGEYTMKISATPPRNASLDWFEKIAEMGRSLEVQEGVFMLKLQPQDPDSKVEAFSRLPNVRAGDVGVEQCAICMEDVGADEKVMQLPCNHAYHPICAARWLTQRGRRPRGKRQCCPLCCRKLVSTADGGISTVEDAQDRVA